MSGCGGSASFDRYIQRASNARAERERTAKAVKAERNRKARERYAKRKAEKDSLPSVPMTVPAVKVFA